MLVESNNKNNLINKKRERSSSKKEEKKQIDSKQETIKTKINSIINEKNQNKINIPSFDAPLVSLALFNELQANIFDQEIIDNAYADYKVQYEAKRYSSFYVEHQNDEWFKEKYDPEIYVKWKNERNSQAKKISKQFLEWYKEIEGKIKLELNEEDEFNKKLKIVLYTCNKEQSDFEEKERDITKLTTQAQQKDCDIVNEPYYGFDPDKLTLFIHQLPRNISRTQILEVAKKVPGFIALSLSEPIKTQNYYRFCWLSFENEEKCDLAFTILKDHAITSDYKMHPINSKSTSVKKIRLTPPLFEERIDEDLENTKKLIEIFDQDKEIESNTIFDNENNRNKELQLDIQLLYLRRVHGFCYYCLKEYEDERNLATKCDNAHLRNYKKIGKRENNINNESLAAEIEFDKFFTSKVKQLFKNGVIAPPPKYVNSENNEELSILRNNYCKKMTIMQNTERFQCSICNKLFKGENFVYNHIFNKHMSSVIDSVDKIYFDRRKKENYLSDPNKPFEKIKVISSMEEYLNTISASKKFNFSSENKDKSYNASKGSGYQYRDGKPRDKDRKKRHFQREYRDLDDPEGKNDNKKNGISYDDL